jgi:hypothetical protein
MHSDFIRPYKTHVYSKKTERNLINTSGSRDGNPHGIYRICSTTILEQFWYSHAGLDFKVEIFSKYTMV